ncbi:MAG: hypothetical protein ACRCYX_15685 [Dermatophilaceae bacterium]
MFRTSKTDRATDTVAATADHNAADHNAVDHEQTPDAAGSVLDQVTDEPATDDLGPGADPATDPLTEVKELIVDEVLPALLAAVAAVRTGSVAVPDVTVEAADHAPESLAGLARDDVKKRGAGTWVLLLGLAGGAAAFAWRKSHERPDPWATAAPSQPPASSSSPRDAFSSPNGHAKSVEATTAAATATEALVDLEADPVDEPIEHESTGTETVANGGEPVDSALAYPDGFAPDDTSLSSDSSASSIDIGTGKS